MFLGLEADKKQGGGELSILCRRETLETGDYSIDGYARCVTIERKSLEDLISTLSSDRDRFRREHERMAEMGPGNAVVMVEASWRDVLENRADSLLSPKVVHRTALSWFRKYGVPWFFCDSRRWAEESAFRYLEKWYGAEERETAALLLELG